MRGFVAAATGEGWCRAELHGGGVNPDGAKARASTSTSFPPVQKVRSHIGLDARSREAARPPHEGRVSRSAQRSEHFVYSSRALSSQTAIRRHDADVREARPTTTPGHRTRPSIAPWKLLVTIEFTDDDPRRHSSATSRAGSGRAFARRHF